jgi:two-component system response regulator
MINKTTLLLVENNPVDESLATRILSKYHIWNEVIVARDGEEAWEYLTGTGRHAGRNASDVPQLVISSVAMPKLNGIELLRKVRTTTHTRRVPMLLVASSREEEELVTRQQTERTVTMVRPFGFFKLLEALQKLGIYWIILSEPPL